jgi:hypothetical protein
MGKRARVSALCLLLNGVAGGVGQLLLLQAASAQLAGVGGVNVPKNTIAGTTANVGQVGFSNSTFVSNPHAQA